MVGPDREELSGEEPSESPVVICSKRERGKHEIYISNYTYNNYTLAHTHIYIRVIDR